MNTVMDKDLTDVTISENGTFYFCTFKNVTFRGTHFVFERCTFSDVTFEGNVSVVANYCNICDVTVKDCTLTIGKLMYSELKNIECTNSTIIGVDNNLRNRFEGALRGLVCSSLKMSETTLEDLTISDAIFSDCKVKFTKGSETPVLINVINL